MMLDTNLLHISSYADLSNPLLANRPGPRGSKRFPWVKIDLLFIGTKHLELGSGNFRSVVRQWGDRPMKELAPSWSLRSSWPNQRTTICWSSPRSPIARFSAATDGPPPTTIEPPVRLPVPPEKQLYPITSDYHWPTFNANATHVDGAWSAAAGIGYGPFGFGSSVLLHDEEVTT